MAASVIISGVADHPNYFTICHCRFSTIQPAWEGCITAKTVHWRCWHFCPCSSLKTIPSLTKQVVTHTFTIGGCIVTTLPVSFAQWWVVITTVGWKVNCNSKKKWYIYFLIWPWLRELIIIHRQDYSCIVITTLLL